MIACLLLFCVSQTYYLPSHLEKPHAYWGDWDGDGLDEIWVKDGNKEHWIIDQDGQPQHLNSDQSPQRVFPFIWQSTWHAATILHGHICVFREGNWYPVLDFHGQRFRPGGRVQIQSPFLIIPTLNGYLLIRDGCIVGTLKQEPILSLGKTSMEIQFPDIRLQFINRDDIPDFQSTPVVHTSLGILRLNSYIGQRDFWVPIKADLNFPPQKMIQKWALGHLDSDAYPDLVFLVAQPQGGSIFGEMEMIIYKGEGPGKWGNLPLQTIQTHQNIWQEGPIEISRQGIRLFYYKGLIRSLFRIDFYPLMESDVIQPDPESHGWKVKGADRSVILIQQDLNRDGRHDLILSGEEGLMCYPADSNSHFSKKSGYRIGKEERDLSVVISIGGGGMNTSFSQGGQGVKGNGRSTMVLCKDSVQIWTLDRDLTGQWVLRRSIHD